MENATALLTMEPNIFSKLGGPSMDLPLENTISVHGAIGNVKSYLKVDTRDAAHVDFFMPGFAPSG